MKRYACVASVLATALTAFGLIASVEAGEVQRMRVYYVGNSLTMNTMPDWHPELGKSAGKEWVTRWHVAAGAPIWMLRERLETDAKRRDEFLNQPWDAMTLQPFGWWGLERQVDGKERGDLHNAAEMIKMFLGAHPDGQVLIYTVWPSMEPTKTDGKQDRENPNRAAFDYEKHWQRKYDPEAKWTGNTFRTRDYHYRLFEALKARFPDLWGKGRLRMIPSGDVFFELNRKMRAGKVPGVQNIADYYTDIQHLRAGLPRYTAAAIFYACLFRKHPGKLDWKLYKERPKYGPDPYHDIGELLEITDDRVKVVNDTVWEVVTAHPYAGLKK